MQTFSYTARDESGAAVSGAIAAVSLAEATRLIRAEGKYPTAVQVMTQADRSRVPGMARGEKISRKDLLQISQQLQIMIETGVTLSEALDCIASQAHRPNVKRLVQDLSQQVQAGNSLSAAMLRHPRSFPRLYIALIAASEKSGMLTKLLARASEYVRDEYEVVRKVKGALTYPAIMLLFAIGTTTFLLTFVLPKFTAIYASKGAALPVPTQILMKLSDIMIHQWPWIVGGVLGSIIGAWLYSRTRPGARLFHTIQLRTPFLGALFRKLHLSRGLRMVGTMAGAGVSLVECVSTAHDLCANTHFRELWNVVSTQIQAGKQLSEPLFHSALVPKSISQMLHSAEKGGKLASVMEQVAAYSEQELKETISEMTKYVEPVMIAVMGAIIGGVALALMLPIFTISKVVAQ